MFFFSFPLLYFLVSGIKPSVYQIHDKTSKRKQVQFQETRPHIFMLYKKPQSSWWLHTCTSVGFMLSLQAGRCFSHAWVCIGATLLSDAFNMAGYRVCVCVHVYCSVFFLKAHTRCIIVVSSVVLYQTVLYCFMSRKGSVGGHVIEWSPCLFVSCNPHGETCQTNLYRVGYRRIRRVKYLNISVHILIKNTTKAQYVCPVLKPEKQYKRLDFYF